MNHRRWVLHGLLLALTGCTSHSFVVPEPSRDVEVRGYFDAVTTKKVDLLFVVDNSGSMEEEQRTLERNFPELLAELAKIEGGAPDLHIAVVNTDMGAGPTDDACRDIVGSRGRFQRGGDGCGLSNGAFFISDDGKGGKNYARPLGETFGCMTKVGTRGCGYEHQLQAMRVALLGDNAENRGFLRDDAWLAIVLVTDEDDCSAPFDSDLFEPEIAGESASFRCAQRGHLCNGNAPGPSTFSTPLAQCRSAPDGGGKLIPVREIVDHIKALKARPDRIVVSAIAGWPVGDQPGTYRVERSTDPDQLGLFDLMPVCKLERASESRAEGDAMPALRIREFIESFPANRRTFRSICEADFRPALRELGQVLRAAIESRCVQGLVADADTTQTGVQPMCFVQEVSPSGMPRRLLPVCGAGGTTPCYRLLPDSRCGQYRFELDHGGAPAPADATYLLKCAGVP